MSETSFKTLEATELEHNHKDQSLKQLYSKILKGFLKVHLIACVLCCLHKRYMLP